MRGGGGGGHHTFLMLRLFYLGRPVTGLASTRLFPAECTMRLDTLPQLRRRMLRAD